MPKDELDTVSDLRYSWKKLHKLATDVSDGLAKMQVRLAPRTLEGIAAVSGYRRFCNWCALAGLSACKCWTCLNPPAD